MSLESINGIPEYIQTLSAVPSLTEIFKSLALSKSENVFTGLKITSGVLAKLNHVWELKIRSEKFLIVRLTVQPYPNMAFNLDSVKVEMLSRHSVISQSDFTVSLAYRPTTTSDYIWNCQTSFNVPNCSLRWDGNVDSLRVTFNFQSDYIDKLINLPNENYFPSTSTPAATISNNGLNTKKYFLNSFLSDVTLVCGKEKFPAHRLILVDHSAVFESMFLNQMKETREGIVEIEDVEPEVLKEMLHFIYTGEITQDKLSTEVYIDLFKIAEKYGIEDLKSRCKNHIMETLGVVNSLV